MFMISGGAGIICYNNLVNMIAQLRCVGSYIK